MSTTAKDKEIFIDRDPTCFGVRPCSRLYFSYPTTTQILLNYLRYNKLILPSHISYKLLCEEADFYGIELCTKLTPNKHIILMSWKVDFSNRVTLKLTGMLLLFAVDMY